MRVRDGIEELIWTELDECLPSASGRPVSGSPRDRAAALQELLVEGRVRRRHGRGRPEDRAALSIDYYAEGALRQGRKPGRTLVGLDVEFADPTQAAHVGIEAGDELPHLERILLPDDDPMGPESTFLPAARFPRLRTDFDSRTSLYAYLRSADVEFRSAVEHIETVLAPPREAALLGTNPRCRCCCSTGSPRTRADAPSSGSARCSAETVSASSPNSALSGGFPAGDRRQLLGLGPIDPHIAVVLLGTGICSMTGRESVDPPGSG